MPHRSKDHVDGLIFTLEKFVKVAFLYFLLHMVREAHTLLYSMTINLDGASSVSTYLGFGSFFYPSASASCVCTSPSSILQLCICSGDKYPTLTVRPLFHRVLYYFLAFPFCLDNCRYFCHLVSPCNTLEIYILRRHTHTNK